MPALCPPYARPMSALCPPYVSPMSALSLPYVRPGSNRCPAICPPAVRCPLSSTASAFALRLLSIRSQSARCPPAVRPYVRAMPISVPSLSQRGHTRISSCYTRPYVRPLCPTLCLTYVRSLSALCPRTAGPHAFRHAGYGRQGGRCSVPVQADGCLHARHAPHPQSR